MYMELCGSKNYARVEVSGPLGPTIEDAALINIFHAHKATYDGMRVGNGIIYKWVVPVNQLNACVIKLAQLKLHVATVADIFILDGVAAFLHCSDSVVLNRFVFYGSCWWRWLEQDAVRHPHHDGYSRKKSCR